MKNKVFSLIFVGVLFTTTISWANDLVILTPSDGTTQFKVSKKVAQMSKLVEGMLADDDDETPEITLLRVDADTLKEVIEFCEHHENASMPPIQKPITGLTEIGTEWDRSFIASKGEYGAHNLLLAANYLDIPSLRQLAHATIAHSILGKTPAEIRGYISRVPHETEESIDGNLLFNTIEYLDISTLYTLLRIREGVTEELSGDLIHTYSQCEISAAESLRMRPHALTNTGARFLQRPDLEETSLIPGQVWEDPSGLVWYDAPLRADGVERYMSYEGPNGALAFCESMGLRLPTGEEFVRLRGWMTPAGGAYSAQVLPHLKGTHPGIRFIVHSPNIAQTERVQVVDSIYGLGTGGRTGDGAVLCVK